MYKKIEAIWKKMPLSFVIGQSKYKTSNIVNNSLSSSRYLETLKTNHKLDKEHVKGKKVEVFAEK